MTRKKSLKTRILGILSWWHGFILAPIHILEIIGSSIGCAIIVYGLFHKEGSKVRNFLLDLFYMGVVAPFIVIKALAAWKGADDYLDQLYMEAKEKDEKKFRVIRNEK